MKRNQARIQRILGIRKRQEEAARATWLQAEGVAREAERTHQEQTVRLRQGLLQLRESMGQSGPQELLHGHWALDRQREYVELTQEQARQAARHAETQKDPWLESRKTLEAMEKWKERAHQAWRQERTQKEEQAMESNLEAHLARKNLNEKSQ